MNFLDCLCQHPLVISSSNRQLHLSFNQLKHVPISANLVTRLIAEQSIPSPVALRLLKFIRQAVLHNRSNSLLLQYNANQNKTDYLVAIYVTASKSYRVQAQKLDSSIAKITVAMATDQSCQACNNKSVATAQALTASTQVIDDNEVNFLAFHDPLTGLPNRTLAIDRLQQSIINSEREQKYYALVFVDVDDFKFINDSLGHNVGDEVLKAIANRLSQSVRAKDTVARLGGDEFLVILSSLSTSQSNSTLHTNNIVKKLSSAVKQCIVVEQHRLTSSVSIGITLFKGKSHTVKSLMQQADMAMYNAKGALKGSYEFFNEVMREKLLDALQLEQDLQIALNQQQFTLYFQAKFNDGKQLIGAEALLRWRHPIKGLVYPGEFISALENSNLIFEFGYWLVTKACQQLAQWQHVQALADINLSINISAKQFNDKSFSDKVSQAISQYQVKPGTLIFEITESLLLDNIDKAILQLNQLSKLGVKFSIDDFGTGYSSLLYLKQLPIHEVKIDRSFIENLVTDKADEMIAKTIISLAHNFQLAVVAEGVEEQEQLNKLVELGCHQFQGYLFSQALPEQEFTALATTLSKQHTLAQQSGIEVNDRQKLMPVRYILSQLDYWIKRHTMANITLLVCNIKNLPALDVGFGLSLMESALASAVKRISQIAPDNALISQQSRGCFVVLLPPNQTGHTPPSHLAQHFTEVVKRPMSVQGVIICLNPTVAVGAFPDDGDDADGVTQALLTKVTEPRQTSAYLSQVHWSDMKFVLMLQQAFRASYAKALPELLSYRSSSEFELLYQPIMALDSNQIKGVELSISWLPDGARAQYDKAMMLMDEMHLAMLNTLTVWSLYQGIEQLSHNGLTQLTVTLSISYEQLECDERFGLQLYDVIKAQPDTAKRLTIELTQAPSELSQQVLTALTKLKSRGVKLSCATSNPQLFCQRLLTTDDIYDQVKLTINSKVTSTVANNPRAELDLAALTSLSTVMQLARVEPVIAGVDTFQDSAKLQQLGIQEAQGRGYCSALNINRLNCFLSQYNNKLSRGCYG